MDGGLFNEGDFGSALRRRGFVFHEDRQIFVGQRGASRAGRSCFRMATSMARTACSGRANPGCVAGAVAGAVLVAGGVRAASRRSR